MAFSSRPGSLRARLTLLTAIGATVVVAATGGLVFRDFDGALQKAVNDGLRARSDDIESAIQGGSLQLSQEEAFAQVVLTDGRVLASSATIPASRQVLTPEEVRRASQHEIVVDRAVEGLAAHARLLARPDQLGSTRVVIVVGTSLETEHLAQRRVTLFLLVGGPLLVAALALTSWFVVGAALHPAERMAEEAEAISMSETGRRLPEPPGDHELAHLGAVLNAMLGRIEQAFARERAFVDDAGHELRTPLAIMRGELELALAQPHDEAAVRETLESALEEVERLSRLADDLLVLARAGDHSLSLRLERIDLLETAAAASGRVPPPDGVTIEVRGDPVTLRADPLRLEQILVNLLTNATRFARERVVVRADRSEGRPRLFVADDGPGFPPELLPRAFDRFARASAARTRGHGGTGLGLAIVAALAAAHGATVQAGNGPPLGGAVVAITFPPDPGDVEPVHDVAT